MYEVQEESAGDGRKERLVSGVDFNTCVDRDAEMRRVYSKHGLGK